MSLHTDWADAKKDSKAKYKLAVKAKRDALEKDIKAGDKTARAKVLDKNLKDLGIDNDEDVDAYFKFKEDFGPTLDKYEKVKAAGTKVANAIQQIKQIGQILDNAALMKAFIPFAKRVAIDDFVSFVTTGYKEDPVKAYATYIRAGAPMEINIDDSYLDPLRQLGNNPAALKAQGPALLVQCRNQAMATLGPDAVSKFTKSPECAGVFGDAADSTALKKKVAEIADSYKRQIEAKAANWKGINPDFRKPLLDALAAIKAAL